MCQTGPTLTFCFPVSVSSPSEAFKGEQWDFLHDDKAHSVPHFGEPQSPSMHLSRHVLHTAWWP